MHVGVNHRESSQAQADDRAWINTFSMTFALHVGLQHL